MLKKLTNKLVTRLQENKLTIAFAESVTCGLASHSLSNTKGISDVLMGAIICYRPNVKLELLKVDQKLIDKYTCESMEVTRALARNLSKLIVADMHIGVTGLASAGGTETSEKPVGTIFICIRYKNKTYTSKKLFRGTPLEIKKKACEAIYNEILKIIK